MASTYSDLGLELMVTGENAGTWGDKTNSNLNLIQQAVGGYEAITLTSGGTVTLAMTDATLSTARNMIIKFATATIASSTICTIPDGIEKFYIFDCSGLTDANNLTIKTVSGTGFSPTTAGAASPKIFAAYSDGTNIVEVSLNTLGGTIATAQIEAAAITTALISDNAVTTAKISDNQITTAKISDNQITTAKVSDLQITTAKIADDSITPDKLSNTAVTPAEYTVATITVDAQGRITAASSGAAGGGNMVVTTITNSSGNVTTGANASKALVYLAGAGGGCAPATASGRRAGDGGGGGYGVYGVAVDPSTTYPFTIGSGGNGGNPSGEFGNVGNAGQASNFGNLATANAGNGSMSAPINTNSGNIANNGNAPGADFDLYNRRDFFGFTTGGAGGTTTNRTGGTGSAGSLVLFTNKV